MKHLSNFFALLALWLTSISLHAADLLVLMHDSGKVERYDAEGKHLGTFISGLAAPNAQMEGPDGRLYVSTGVPGQNGTVERLDAKTGLRLGTFINLPAGQPGHLARATGMTWHEGDLLVASQGDGIVKRFDGKTGVWKADVAKASPGGFTQIAMQGGRLFLTDFVTHMIRVSDMKGTDTMAPVWTQSDGDAAWGLVFDAEGRAFWSTGRQRIMRFDGKENVEWAHGLATPVWLSVGPDGRLYAVNHTGPNVTVWDAKAPNPGGPERVIGGPEMQMPIAVAFTTHPFEPPVQVGNFTPKPSNTGKDWTPDGTAIYNLRALKGAAAITDFGLDTEGGDRAKLNLLKEPMRLIFTLKDGSRVESSQVAATSETGAQQPPSLPGSGPATNTTLKKQIPIRKAGIPREEANKLFRTPHDLLGAMQTYEGLQTIIKVARVLGEEQDVKTYEAIAARVGKRINSHMDAATGAYAKDSQSLQVLALANDIPRQEHHAKVLDYLKRNIVETRKGHFSVGATQLREFFRVLSKEGEGALAVKVMHQPGAPGFVDMLNHGVTAVWERWDGKGSFNSHDYATVADWFFADLAGIQPDPQLPGFKRIVFKPDLACGLESASADYESVRGRIVSDWKIENGRIVYDILVPPGCDGKVLLPASADIVSPPDATRKGEENGRAVFITGSGKFRFEIPVSDNK